MENIVDGQLSETIDLQRAWLRLAEDVKLSACWETTQFYWVCWSL